MEQHPVPQHVSSYQFKLVGDMTLKQFFQLAGGALISLVFYASGLHPLIKWPAVIFFAIAGVALAFLPFEDRPLEKWVVAFFKSIYSPTLYFWQRTKQLPLFYQEEATPPTEKIIASGGQVALETYLSQTPEKQSAFFTRLEGTEKDFLTKILGLFGAGELKPKPASLPQETTPAFYGVAPQPVVQKPAPPAPPPTPTEAQLFRVNPITFSAPVAQTAAQFSAQAAPPLPPTAPNLITGQVMDSQGRIVEAAIMEIRDSTGRPVRALKTNKLGHFIIVTPLANGNYEIVTEKEGLDFEPLTFEASGTIIPPIAIRASAAANNQMPTTYAQPTQTVQMQ